MGQRARESRISARSCPRAAVAYTWSENAHEFRLTPWSNDPVSDRERRSLLPARRGDRAFLVADAAARARWRRRTSRGMDSATASSSTTKTASSPSSGCTLPLDAAVKFFAAEDAQRVGTGAAALGVTGYVEWVLGDLRTKTAMHVVTEIDAKTRRAVRAQCLQHRISPTGSRSSTSTTRRAALTCDRTEFIGRNGSLRNTRGDGARRGFRARSGAALDPCAAIQVPFELADGRSARVIFRLGAGRNADDARSTGAALPRRGRGARRARRRAAHWQHTLGAVQRGHARPGARRARQRLAAVSDARVPAVGAQRLLPIRRRIRLSRSVAGRRWRWCTPSRARCAQHLLRCAARQFVEGDVQHWWHPPSGRGVRTHCSDDYLWLPLAHCALRAGDRRHRRARRIGAFPRRPPGRIPEDESYYDLPGRPAKSATLYEHCVRAHRARPALRRARPAADGLRRLERRHEPRRHPGQGRERLARRSSSVAVLAQFAEVARLRGDAAFAERCDERSRAKLRANIEQHGWDGEWYRRAYFDDGTPLGSARNAECRIDSIAQSWSVLSGAGDAERSRAAMDAVDTAPRAPRRCADPAARSAVRQVDARSGLHQGLRARRARERRPVHARARSGR